MKKIYLIIVSLSLSLFLPNFVSALIINEIMYDLEGTDTDREWIEVFNENNESVNLSEWKLLENKVNHVIKYISGNEIIEKNQFAIIADNAEIFMTDNPNYTGPLFESVFSLSNTGEELSLVNQLGNIIDTKSYSTSLGAKGDGLSLQLLLEENIFISAQPTMGEVNALEPFDAEKEKEEESTGENDNEENISSHNSQIDLSSGDMTKNITVHAGRERLSTVFTPVIFEGATKTQGSAKKVKFLWNFGDGYTGKGKKIEHIYKHPGIYNVVLNAISGSDRAVSRTKVNVFYPDTVLENKEDGILIKNNSNYELNIGEFELDFGKEEFVFPEDTIISKNSETLFDWSVIKISASSSVEFRFPSGKVLTVLNKE